MNECYKLLNLEPGANSEQIKSAYDTLRADIQRNLAVISNPEMREQMHELLVVAGNAAQFLLTFTNKAETAARAAAKKAEAAQQQKAEAAAREEAKKAEAAQRAAAIVPVAKPFVPSTERAPPRREEKRWNVDTEGVESLDEATLDHLVGVACGAGNHLSSHAKQVGSKLVPVLVKAGDWRRLITLSQSASSDEVRHFAMHGIGMVMQIMAASGKPIPDELHQAALDYVDDRNYAALSSFKNDVGGRLAGFYSAAGLWMPLVKLANHAGLSDTVRIAALDSLVDLVENSLKNGKDVPESAYSVVISACSRSDLLTSTKRQLGMRLLGICHEHGVKSVLLKFASAPDVGDTLQQKANLLALDLVSGVKSSHPDPVHTVRRQMARAIETKNAMQRALPPAQPRALPPPVPLDALRQRVLALPAKPDPKKK